MPFLRVAPFQDIAIEVASRLAAGREGRDPLAAWEEGVLVPSQGAAAAITKELLARVPSGVAGLPMSSLEVLATRILNAHGQMPRVASTAERRLAMRLAVRSLNDSLGSREDVPSLMASRGIAAMLERSYRDVRDSARTVADVARRAGSIRGLRSARRTELVTRAWTEYERRIALWQAIDPSELFFRASRFVDESVPPQVLAGFYDMTGAQWQFAEALLRAGRVSGVWIPTQAPFAQPFAERVLRYAETAAAGVPTRPDAAVTLTVHDTRANELREICTLVAGRLAAGDPPGGIGIVARSLEPYDVRLLRRFARENGFALDLNEETPLAAHRIGRGVLTLLRLRERGFLRGDVLSLLRDGLRVSTKAGIDACDAATRQARIAGGTAEELARLRNRSQMIDAYIDLVKELDVMTAQLDLDFLSRLGGAFRLFTEADLAAAEALDAIAAMFRHATQGADSLRVADVIDAIEQQSLPVPTTGRSGPLIWAGELPRFRGRTFEHLYAIRMQDDVFPQRRTEDPLLPDSDRALLGLREIGDGREEEDLLFSLLRSSAGRTLHVSYASGDGFGKVLRGSRYVREVPRHALPGRASTIAVDKDPHPEPQNTIRQLQLVVRSGTRSPFDGYLHPIQPGQLRALSPTQLEDFGECPQKFLFKHILGARDIDHPERELQIHQREKGILDHGVLEELYRSMTDEDYASAMASLPQLPAALAERLERIVEARFEQHERDVPPFNRTVRDIERGATKRLLREFVIDDLADLEAQGLRPRAFEYRFGSKHRERADHPEPFIVETSGVPVRVEGTIDRIDVSETAAIGWFLSQRSGENVPVSANPAPAARFRIVDYKSGKALRHVNLGDKIDRGVRLQLALYAMAVADILHLDPSQVSGTIKPLVAGETKPARFAFALEEKRSGLQETLEIFIAAILRGHFPAFPNEREELNSCKYCPVNHSCRTRHDLDERYAVQQYKDPRTLLGAGSAEPAGEE